jgi:hypothetical protein
MSELSSVRPTLRGYFMVSMILGSLWLAGCGGSKKDTLTDLVPVSGKVTVGGTPVPIGQVNFYPDTSKGTSGESTPSGSLKADGSYSLKTAANGYIKDGAPPGWYKVTVSSGAASEPEQWKAKMPTFSNDYANEKNTPLSIEVKSGAPAGAYDLKLR